jgi:hypothetical protein
MDSGSRVRPLLGSNSRWIYSSPTLYLAYWASEVGILFLYCTGISIFKEMFP